MQRRMAILATLLICGWSSISFADGLQIMKEGSDPGSTAVGKSVSVLSPWGAPARSAQLGEVTLYTWMFPQKGGDSFGGTYGTVSPSGQIWLNQPEAKVKGCEITARVNRQGIVEAVTMRKLGVMSAYNCEIPRWYE